MPALTRNRAGSGSVYAVPFPESALAKSPEVLDELWKDALPDPLWKLDGKSKRCTVRIRRQPGRYVVHVIDDLMPTPQNPMGVYRPGYLKLSLNAASIRFQKATVMPDNRPLKVASSGGWSTIEVYPDPELIVVLE